MRNAGLYGKRNLRIKAVAALFSLLVLCTAVAASAAPAADDAEELRAFLESTYGVKILMGDECAGYTLDDYDVRIDPKGFPAFQQLEAGNSRFVEVLQRLWGTLSVYPEGFFRKFSGRDSRDGLLFLLVDGIRRDGANYGGVQSGPASGPIIFLAKDDAKERVLHHEIWHAMEYRICREDPHAFDGWDLLNPAGFRYTGDFSVVRRGKDKEIPEDWFAEEYGKTDEYEDRASVFSAFMIREKGCWETRARLKRKLRFLLEKAEPVFGKIIAEE